MHGQKLAFAESSKPGDTTLETDKITFSSIKLDPPPSGKPWFFPIVSMADVRLAALEQMAGQQAQPQHIQLYPKYVESGYGSENTGKVFVELIDPNDVIDPSYPKRKPKQWIC